METSTGPVPLLDGIFFVAIIAIAGLSAFIGIPSPLGSFAHDTFFFLDNAYRVVQGQVPHRDFSSAWGPVIFLIDGAGLLLTGMDPRGLGVANGLFGALIAIWTYALARTRCTIVGATILGIYAMLLIVAPSPLGIAPRDFGYAMDYNRYGYALTGIILIECGSYLLGIGNRVRSGRKGPYSTGMALALLLFLKISYPLIAIPLIVVTLFSCEGQRRGAAICVGFISMALPILAYLRFDLTDMLSDLAMAAHSRRLSLDPLSLLQIRLIGENLPLLLIPCVLISGRVGRFGNPGTPVLGILIALLAFILGNLLLLTNQQLSGFPLNAYAAVILVAAAATSSARSILENSSSRIATLIAGLCLLPLMMQNGISVAAAATEQIWPTQARGAGFEDAERGQAMRFSPVIGRRKTETDGPELVEDVNDGIALLRRDTSSHDGVLVIDMFNPFNYLLDRPSPRGGFAAAAYNYIFCDASHPSAERYFGDARYALIHIYKKATPNRPPEDYNVLGLLKIYGTYLHANFTLVETTEHWSLWRRR